MSAETKLTEAKLRETLTGAGFDLFQHFGVGTYNRRAAPDARLPDFGRSNAWGFLIGNSRKLWPVFLKQRAASSDLREATHPLDLYAAQAITRAARLATDRSFELVFAHVIEPSPFPIQRLAEQIGFAQLAPSHLAAHPELGPWFGLRAVGVLDLEVEQEAAPGRARPCDGCPAPCLAAFDRALAQTGGAPTPASIAGNPSPWIAIRDACPVGKQHRYGPHQLAYHYTGSPAELREELRDAEPSDRDAQSAEPQGS